jgi:hypothetical protein
LFINRGDKNIALRSQTRFNAEPDFRALEATRQNA